MNLLAGIFNKEQMVFDTIQDTLLSISEELGCKHTELFVMIKPENEKFDPKFHVYKLENNQPKYIRDISIKEILGEDE